ncbi:MAG: 50S ribosomal protein L34 [Candidatus Omnitrophica bacterium]|nr:50S ribosomal protein L34 [Candidatus Omnitrophota bacterium]MDD5654534.1 50S ribosomal protein L34 [Candidatus Omnitrophota bacterium]
MKKHLKTPTIIVAKRRHGFRKRMKTEHGRNVIKRRRLAGRRKLSI